MERDIRIAMPQQAFGMRHANAAEPEFLTLCETMDVEALCGSNAHRRGMPRLGGGEVGGVGDLLQRDVSGNEGNGVAERADHLRVVGGLAVGGPSLMRRADRGCAECLRSLDADETVAWHGFAEPLAALR